MDLTGFTALSEAQVKESQSQADSSLTKVNLDRGRLRAKLLEINGLMLGGGSFEVVRAGWVAFEYLRTHLPPTILSKVVIPVLPPEGYKSEAWIQLGKEGHPEPLPEAIQDVGLLTDWARKHNYVPAFMQAAWKWVAAYLSALSEAATIEATIIQQRIDLAHKEAKELEEKV